MSKEKGSHRPLRRGYTTGACAAAAAKAAALAMISGVPIYRVQITLPAGTPLVLAVKTLQQDERSASCSVTKDAGDDPDVTHGAEMVAHIGRDAGEVDANTIEIRIRGGKGVGRVTKPGLPVAVGEWAVNPVPRSMIDREVREVLRHFGKRTRGRVFNVTLEVPEGEALAPRTLNPRLGIIGGISILGTTGIVEPISAKAWEDTVAVQINVAAACGNTAVVLTPGRSSEKAAQELFPDLPEEAFVQMGDFVASSLRISREKGMQEVIIVAMPGKMSKIAMGYGDTHYRASEMRFDDMARWARELDMKEEIAGRIARANTAREIWEFLPGGSPLYPEICRRARLACEGHTGAGITVRTVMIGYEGAVLGRAGVWGIENPKTSNHGGYRDNKR